MDSPKNLLAQFSIISGKHSQSSGLESRRFTFRPLTPSSQESETTPSFIHRQSNEGPDTFQSHNNWEAVREPNSWSSGLAGPGKQPPPITKHTRTQHHPGVPSDYKHSQTYQRQT